MQRLRFVLKSDGVAFAAVAKYVYNFLVKSHAHLLCILHGMYSSYSLMKDDCRMGIGMVIVDDDTHKLKASSPCLSWKITW